VKYSPLLLCEQDSTTKQQNPAEESNRTQHALILYMSQYVCYSLALTQ